MRTDRNNTKNIINSNSTPQVTSEAAWNTIGIDSNEFKELVAAGNTFRYITSFSNSKAEWYSPETIRVSLTCRQEKRGKNFYYFAKWKDPRNKKQRRAYIGKAEAITIGKLEAIAKRFERE